MSFFFIIMVGGKLMEELTLYKHIYKDCEMSIFSLDTLT